MAKPRLHLHNHPLTEHLSNGVDEAAGTCQQSSAPGRDVAQPGSASHWGCGGRRFESCRPDQ
jgi:hypothetical protein